MRQFRFDVEKNKIGMGTYGEVMFGATNASPCYPFFAETLSDVLSTPLYRSLKRMTNFFIRTWHSSAYGLNTNVKVRNIERHAIRYKKAGRAET